MIEDRGARGSLENIKPAHRKSMRIATHAVGKVGEGQRSRDCGSGCIRDDPEQSVIVCSDKKAQPGIEPGCAAYSVAYWIVRVTGSVEVVLPEVATTLKVYVPGAALVVL